MGVDEYSLSLQRKPRRNLHQYAATKILHFTDPASYEQIGPHLWHGAVYETRPMRVNVHDDAGNVIDTQLHHVISWELFTCLSESCVKRCALVTVENRLADRNLTAPALEGDWSDDSGQPNEEWKAELLRLAFPGYRDRDGFERFQDL